MSHATRIDGKAYAETLLTNVRSEVEHLKTDHALVPGLAVVLVGTDPASQVYVHNKGKKTRDCGMNSYEYLLPESTSEAALLEQIQALNHNPAVHGILVQLPLPSHINETNVINAIDPAKDVDGFHVINVGKLATGQPGTIPCTPKGCLMLLKASIGSLSGLKAIVIGRSNIVGKPMAQLLLAESCTVTIAHSRTRHLQQECLLADIVVSAVGIPKMVRSDWIKPGAIVIDVGINRIAAPDGKSQLVGDVDFDDVSTVAGAITPVPGGVGPMTIACLLENTLEAAKKQHGLL